MWGCVPHHFTLHRQESGAVSPPGELGVHGLLGFSVKSAPCYIWGLKMVWCTNERVTSQWLCVLLFYSLSTVKSFCISVTTHYFMSHWIVILNEWDLVYVALLLKALYSLSVIHPFKHTHSHISGQSTPSPELLWGLFILIKWHFIVASQWAMTNDGWDTLSHWWWRWHRGQY